MNISLISDANALNKAVRQTVHDQLIDKFKNPDDLWKWRIISGLFSLTFEHYDSMMDAYKRNRPISTLAFHARSLLELLVWTKYALDSDENIKQIEKDWLVNAKDIVSTLKERSVRFDAELAETKLADLAQLSGYQELSGSYLRTNQLPVGKEVTEYYVAANKILSKLAHPSGLTIAGLIGKADEAELMSVIINDASNWFMAIIKALLVMLDDSDITRKPDCK